MITDFLINLGAGFVSFLAGLFPVWTPPAWFVSFPSYVNAVFGSLDGLGAWVDWVLLFGVVAAGLGTYLVCLAIKLVLRIATYLPLIGGAG